MDGKWWDHSGTTLAPPTGVESVGGPGGHEILENMTSRKQRLMLVATIVFMGVVNQQTSLGEHFLSFLVEGQDQVWNKSTPSNIMIQDDPSPWNPTNSNCSFRLEARFWKTRCRILILFIFCFLFILFLFLCFLQAAFCGYCHQPES